jgi:hypothetical protein
MIKYIIVGLLFSSSCFAQQQQIVIPLDLDAQIKIIPTLCDNAIYSNRRLFTDFCAEMIEKLRIAAKEKAEKKPNE